MLMTVLPSMDVLQAVDKVKVEGTYKAYENTLKEQTKEYIKKQYKDNKEDIIIAFEINYGLISGPGVYQNYIENNFFNKSDIIQTYF